jgi:hypothetical protein
MKSNKIMSKRLKSYCSITPDYQTVDDLADRDEQLEFIKAFREVMRYNAQLQTFIEYDQDDTKLDKQHFANFASKYADLCRAIRKTTKKKKFLCWMMSISNWICCTVTVSMWVIS